MDKFLEIKNGEMIGRRAIPYLNFADFCKGLLRVAARGASVVQFFGYKEDPLVQQDISLNFNAPSREFFGYEEEGSVQLLAVMRMGGHLYAIQTTAPESFESLSQHEIKFQLFEREIAEQFGLTPLGHPWLKPVRYHTNWRGVKDVFDNDYNKDIPGNYPYFQVEGEEIHEVAVGPVHAGIIEPGHFRFQCIGERILHLEIQLGYQHRGVERLLASVPFKRLPVIAEGIAGDTAIGNSLCFSQAIEALSGKKIDDGTKIIRTVALELERIANHVGDLGALSGDVAFNSCAAYFGRIRGEFLNLLLVLSGNRFGKGLIRPGGVTAGLSEDSRQFILDRIRALRPEILEVADLLFTAHTVLARLEGCGVVSREIDMVGVAGRASGIDYDARRDFPTEKYAELPPCLHERTNGGVLSRAWVRYEEILHSLDIIELLTGRGPIETLNAPLEEDAALEPDSLVVTINEAWRGELSHCVLTDSKGGILRYKIKDPSFHNWMGLAMALRNEEISDFPLNNKSFNLSYCGFDL
ncbi:hydrogenase large subunit [Dissulfurimicrobium hydrothermale]|uniref:hydrogenase large subunit n=1 Tax=Dissulfurimicrobium hydrothermale TaxID=1750598 RepID=UPI001EDA0D3A|nr:hydrogenase [Dissulfurimicrobium hydrothermale]UKL12931.1 hydrogenase [Dissulfurimicrobium hydrothermale]